MNKVILMGRLTRDPEIRYGRSDNSLAIAKFNLAVDRRFKRDGEPDADFIYCTAFGKLAEFAEKYLHQGIKIVVVGRIQTGSYTNQEGQRVYTTDVILEEIEFAESKAASERYQQQNPGQVSQPNPEDAVGDGFMNIPDELEEELPFI